jgi:DNA-binding NarL/FixJ family response regulator
MVYMAEPVEKIVDAATRALGRGRLVREQGTALPITGLPVWALIFCERYDEAQRAADEVLAAARAQGSASGFCLAAAIQATIACRLGDLARAEEWGRAALRPDTPRIEAPMALAALIDALRDIGQLEAANEALRTAGLGAEVPDLPIFAVLLGARSGLRLAQGDAEGALADALAVGERAAAWGNRNKTFVQWRAAAALARIALGDLAGARQIASEGVAAARGWGVTRAAGIELRALALASEGGDAIGLLREAAALVLRAGAKAEWARVSTDLGEALRRAGMRREARTTLFPALETAVECGAHALAHRARGELRAAGVQEPDAVRTGADALTAGERRVARLAADGLTNSQIAQSLFVTTKTVEKHLSNAYRKLEVTSRAHLAERLGLLSSAA